MKYVELTDETGCWLVPEGQPNVKISKTARIRDWAEVTENARIEGNAVICGNAEVMGSAQVKDTATVGGDAVVCGDAVIGGSAEVCGGALIMGSARITDHAMIRGNAHIEGNAVIGGNVVIEGAAWISGHALIEKDDDFFYAYPIDNTSVTVYRDRFCKIRVGALGYNLPYARFKTSFKSENHPNLFHVVELAAKIIAEANGIEL